MSDYLLADDLSGALEAGAAFHARGWRVRVPLLADVTDAAAPDELSVITSETRIVTVVEEARDTMRRLLTAQRDSGHRLLLVKIDSTLRGPIGAGIEAVREVLAPPLIVVCPANPLVGRTVINGVLRVNGVPLEQTDFHHDPQWPAHTGDIRTVLQGQGIDGVDSLTLAELRADRISESLKSGSKTVGGSRILVTDAETTDDIRLLVSGIRAAEPGTILIGSAMMATVLAELISPVKSADARKEGERIGSMLLLCGTQHPATHRQIETLLLDDAAAVLTTRVGDGLDVLQVELERAAHSHRVVAVHCTVSARTIDPSRALLDWLTQVATGALAHTDFAALYLTGGETAWAVCRALGGTELVIVCELEPGVILSRMARVGRHDLLVVTKPGGYGAPDAMVKHLTKMMK